MKKGGEGKPSPVVLGAPSGSLRAEVIIGIDPGKQGGIAFNEGGKVHAIKMPETLADLRDALDPYRFGGGFAFLEQVHSSPQMGCKSLFTFGEGFGALKATLTCLHIAFQTVRPQVWQKAMQSMTKGDKNVSKRKAQELFPDIKVTHAIADSLLICEFGCRLRGAKG